MTTRHVPAVILTVTLFTALPFEPVSADIAQTPLNLVHSVPPRILFAMSNDHALYYKAYTDWNDLDGNGSTDTTYLPTFSYYGYFDPAKCYAYEGGRFVPKAVTDASFYCSGQWSGNFLNWATMSRMDIVRKVLYGGYRSTDTATETVLERAFIPSDAHSFAKYYKGDDIAKLTPFSESEITLCNTTYVDSGQSQNVTAAPRISVVKGDFRYWAANERWQCTWDNERGDSSNGTNSTGSNTSDPNKTSDGLGEKDYTARVQVCVPQLLGTEKCQRYPTGNYKPIGLLHEYGEKDQLQFGLMTGSYSKNKSGGVLRKNISSFKDEVNVDTNGTFKGAAGIVDTLNRLRIARYEYGDDKGYYNSTDSCPWGLSSFNDGICSNWGNPLSEIYLESLRYLAGHSPTGVFGADDTGYIPGLTTATWKDPLSSETWCAHCNVILINASETSYDHDAMDSGGLKGSPSATDWTNKLGDLEGISGLDFFVGENGSDNNQLCTAKEVSALGAVRGACPGAPRLSGTYLLTGLAHWAKTKDLRDLDKVQSVTTRAVALLPGVPKLVIPVPGQTRAVSILPACRNTRLSPAGNCAIVDFKLFEQDVQAGTGTAYINWEDSEQGGDYDQDMKGFLNYKINFAANTITVTTRVDRKSTDHILGFGYVIGGTSQDGFHAHTGINGFSYNDPVTGVNYTSTDPTTCSNCDVTEPATSFTYTLGTSTAGLLEQPLWYAAKYGSFNDGNKNDEPDQKAEWDEDGNGLPDGFYLANDPAKLGPALARFLDVISATTSSASVATNSVTLNTDTQIYQGRFDSGDWSGDLIALPVTTRTEGSKTIVEIGKAVWQAREEVNGQAQAGTRRVVTTHESTLEGVPFRWASLAEAQKRALRCLNAPCADADLATDSVGQDRLEYVRGSDDDELQNGGNPGMRDREYKLGDIADSEPVYVGAPASLYPDDIEADSYLDFASKSAVTDRPHVLYVGANDGMLHGFDAKTGAELFGYVPRAVYPNLPRLTTLNYRDNHRYYVNGGPTVADAYIGSQWRTVLVGGLGAGGAGVFAIDVTNPAQLSASESSAAAQVLWDITGADTEFEDLGHTFSKPAVVRMPNDTLGGKWVAVFGNGYHDDPLDTHGKAVLYVVDAADGDLLDTVVAQNGPGNGLSSVAPVDYDGDAKVDFVYAGDLKGNLWRFEPNGTSGWKVSFGGAPLFMDGTPDTTTTETTPTEVCETVTETVCVKTKKGKCVEWKQVTNVVCHTEYVETVTVTPGEYQPITVGPEVVRHPLGGVMVLFGTGSFYREGDGVPNPDAVNAFYGVWDRMRTEDAGGIKTQHLLKQKIVEETTLNDFEVRVTTGNPIKWIDPDADKPTDFPPTTHLGWYLELLPPDGTGEGEVQVTEPIARGGRIIFTTMIPSPAACDFGGEGWLMELDALTGRPMPEPVFDLNGDGRFDDADLVEITVDGKTVKVAPTGKKSKVGVIQEPAIIAAGSKEYKFTSGAKDAGIEVTTENPGELAGGRRSWLQVH